MTLKSVAYGLPTGLGLSTDQFVGVGSGGQLVVSTALDADAKVTWTVPQQPLTAVSGETVVVIEHNMDIIKIADHIIDLGPEGGFRGGEILFHGTPEQMVKKAKEKSYTAKYLALELA